MATKVGFAAVPVERALWIVISFLFVTFGCSEVKQYCGRSFCITRMPAMVQKDAKVDFTFYTIRSNNNTFVVFEGSNPNMTVAKNLGAIDKVPTGFSKATLFRSNDGYTILLQTTNPQSDTYVAVSTASEDLDALKSFVSAFRGR